MDEQSIWIGDLVLWILCVGDGASMGQTGHGDVMLGTERLILRSCRLFEYRQGHSGWAHLEYLYFKECYMFRCLLGV